MSTLKADTIQSTSGGAATLTKQHAAKSWLQYNQVTPAVTGSFNISTVTDTGAGDFTPNFSSAMSALIYSVPVTSGMLNTDASGRIGESNPTNTSSYQVTTTNSAGTKADHTGNSCSTFGDLA
tara:strand:- start:31 stop:399 length:369 start_codon:yes stop_codon:yes gene_type:complete